MQQASTEASVNRHKPLKPYRFTKAQRIPADVRSLCRSYTRKAVKVLAGIMMEAQCPPGVRVHAAEVLLDRGWGKPPQFSTANAEQFLRLMDMSDAELTARLEAVGVRPMKDVTAIEHEPSTDKD